MSHESRDYVKGLRDAKIHISDARRKFVSIRICFEQYKDVIPNGDRLLADNIELRRLLTEQTTRVHVAEETGGGLTEELGVRAQEIDAKLGASRTNVDEWRGRGSKGSISQDDRGRNRTIREKDLNYEQFKK